MSEKKVIIKVDSTGAVSVETKGFKGKSCMEASKYAEDMLSDIRDRKTTLTTEYEQPEQIIRTLGL